MLYVLILVSVALAVTLGMLLLGFSRGGAENVSAQQHLDSESKARLKAEAELEKKRKDLEDQRAQLADAREQLKQAKRKLFDQKESGKGDRDLLKAREEVERNASTQLEVVRNELAQALHEVERLRTEMSGKARRTPERPIVEKPIEKAEKAEAAPEPKKYRDLSDADREKMERWEHEAAKERGRAQEADHELKRLRGRVETQNRVYLVTKGELDLLKDKFKALEKRLNRTLLESDLLRRGMKDLEKKTGVTGPRTELTAEEIAASDRKVDERAFAEAQAAHAPSAPVASSSTGTDIPVSEAPVGEPHQARPA
jgi:chromosome segregation ATPase